MAIRKEITDSRPTASVGNPHWKPFSRNRQNALRIELRSGKTFLLPYGHWVFAHIQKVDGSEELTISFVSHDVRVEGENLRELLLELQASNVELLREIPNGAQQLSDSVIRTLTVTTRPELNLRQASDRSHAP